VDPAGFDFRLVGANGFAADVLHQRADLLQKCSYSRRKGFVAEVSRNWTGEGLPGGDVKLGAVHRTGNELTVERAQFQRCIHVSAASLDGVIGSAAIADDDLASVELDGLHPARRDFIGADCADEFITQGPHPLAAIGAGCPGP
jgi:hypothetical protein